jgi:glycerol-3-phosphate acyltransferase PlsY
MILYVPGFYVDGHRGASLLWALAVVALVVAMHAPNIRRIVSGSETRMGTP